MAMAVAMAMAMAIAGWELIFGILKPFLQNQCFFSMNFERNLSPSKIEKKNRGESILGEMKALMQA